MPFVGLDLIVAIADLLNSCIHEMVVFVSVFFKGCRTMFSAVTRGLISSMSRLTLRDVIICALIAKILLVLHFYCQASGRSAALFSENEGLRKKVEFLERQKYSTIRGFDYLAHDLTGMLDILMFSKDLNSNKQTIAQMMHMIQNMVWIQREGKEIPLSKAWHNLNDIIHEARLLVMPKARARSVQIKLFNETRNQVNVDEQHIRRVFFNLLSNAVKYSSENSTVELQIILASDKELVVEVTNSGPGIDHADLPKVFDAYFQASSSMKDISRGIGLAYSKEVMLAHGAKITVQSKPGHSTTFRLHFTDYRQLGPANDLADKLAEPCLRETDLLDLIISHPDAASIVADLRRAKVYQASHIRKLLTELPSQFDRWKEGLLNAVEQCNEKRFKSLLNIDYES